MRTSLVDLYELREKFVALGRVPIVFQIANYYVRAWYGIVCSGRLMKFTVYNIYSYIPACYLTLYALAAVLRGVATTE